MSYRIIADSCCDKTQYIKDMDNITFVPLTLSVGDYTIPDDNNFDQDDFIGRMKASDTVAKTACPAPDAWAKAFDCAEEDVLLLQNDFSHDNFHSLLQSKVSYCPLQ